MSEQQKEPKKKGVGGKAILAGVIALCIILAGVGSTAIYKSATSDGGGLFAQLTGSGSSSNKGADAISDADIQDVIQKYTMEYLSAPPAAEQVKQLTREEIAAYGDILGTYYTNKNIDPGTTLTQLEGDILNQFSEGQISAIDETILQQLIDASIAIALADMPDYSSIIDELRTKYDNEIAELHNLVNSLEASYTEIKQYTENNTMSVTDAKVIEVQITELQNMLTQVEQELQQFQQFESTINQYVENLQLQMTEQVNNLQTLINETNNTMNQMYNSLQQDLQVLEQMFGDNLTEVYNILENNILNLEQTMNQADQQLQQNIYNESQERKKDVADLNQLLDETAQDLMNQLQETADRLDAKDAELQNNIDITNVRITNEVNELNRVIQEVVQTAIDQLTSDLADLKQYTDTNINNLYETIYGQYHWSTDSEGQTVLTVTTPSAP